MTINRIQKASSLGQSIWLDNIHRSMLEDGGLHELIDQGVQGVTSNPSIFEKAITNSEDYDGQLEQLVKQGASTEEIYEALVLSDIKQAADILRSVYDRTDGLDGFVSLEVSPELANRTEATIAEAKRYFDMLNRPNIMIKVPATEAGIPAIEELIASGVNVNVTLIFARSNYEEVAGAYIKGLKRASKSGKDLRGIASVASFFVSRVDTAVDAALSEIGSEDLKGKIAIANAKLAYRRFKQIFSGEQWERLESEGARVQRPLWASTSTKNPAYPETLYLDSLIGANTVNTVPPATLKSFLEQGSVALTLEEDIADAEQHVDRLDELGVDLSAITEKLQEDGVEAFAKSYRNLLSSISEKAKQMKVKTA